MSLRRLKPIPPWLKEERRSHLLVEKFTNQMRNTGRVTCLLPSPLVVSLESSTFFPDWLAGHVRERPPWSLGEVFLNRFPRWILACLERPGRHLARKAYLLAVNSVTPHRPINKKLTRQSVFFFNKMNFLIYFFLCI